MNELSQLYVVWYLAWRKHVYNAHYSNYWKLDEKEAACRAAMLAQMQYVTYLAQRSWT